MSPSQTPLVVEPPVDVPKPEEGDLRLWSVTTIIGALDKPALLYWAAEETAKAAVSIAKSLPDRIEEEGRDAIIKWLRDARFRRPKGYRSATELGAAVHDACEQYALTGIRPEVDDEVAPFLDQFDRWCQLWQPSYEAAEMSVYSPTYGYAGTLDAIATIGGQRVLLDYKGLALDTPIPTPSGWATIASLSVGDEVFGADGQVCRVIGKSGIRARPCYRVRFDDASSVVCDDEHLWNIQEVRSGITKVLSAAELVDLVRTSDAVSIEAPALNKRWLVAAVEPTVSVPTQCIAVDSLDSTYLCGEQMVPTHNSSRKSLDNRGEPSGPYPEVALQLAAYRYAEFAAAWRPRRYEHFRRRYYLLGEAERAASVPIPEVDGGIAVHITPSHCHAYPVRCDETVHEAFLYVLEAARWQFELSRHVIGERLVHPNERTQ